MKMNTIHLRFLHQYSRFSSLLMTCLTCLYLIAVTSFANAQVAIKTDSYLKALEEQGYCVIPQLFSEAETELLYQRVWHEYIEKAWPDCKMDDRTNWKEVFPIHNLYGIFAGAAGQTQVMWDLRQDPRIVDVFAHVWNTNELIVSMDGMSVMCPPEIREGYFDPWPHVDQAIMRNPARITHNNNPPIGFVSESALKTKPFTIQGQFLLEDSLEGDGGFYCIPKSHLVFEQFAPRLEQLGDDLAASNLSKDEKRKARTDYFNEFFDNRTDDTGNPYCMKHISAPRGSLILWDSRTVHWNQHPAKDRICGENPRVRMVGYLCYVPKSRLTEESGAIRKEAFTRGISTGHNPGYPQLKPSDIWPGYEMYKEDAGYVQPKITLTPLGESLLGF